MSKLKIRDVFSAKSIAKVREELPQDQFLGPALFPPVKKAGLDLKWLKTRKGLGVSLAASAFDAVSTLRGREGFKQEKTEMPFFRESMLIKEVDEQEIMRAQESTDPYVQAILDSIYDDANTLIEGALINPERMIWSLLSPAIPTQPVIRIGNESMAYMYNYDETGEWADNNVFGVALGGTHGLVDLESLLSVIAHSRGVKPRYAVIGSNVWSRIVREYRNAAHASGQINFLSDGEIKSSIKHGLGIEVVLYPNMYIDDNGNTQPFVNPDLITLLPGGPLGKTWFGTTPEERTLMGNSDADVSIVHTGIAVAVSTTNDPVHTKTTVSEIVLPSYERMDEVFVVEVL